MPSSDTLDGLEQKLHQLVDRHRALLTENEQLRAQLARQEGQPAASPNATLPHDHRKALEECIGEIDRCLDWLHHN